MTGSQALSRSVVVGDIGVDFIPPSTTRCPPSGVQPHGHHGLTFGRGRLHQRGVWVRYLRFHLYGIGSGILQVGRSVKGIALSGSNARRLRIPELTDDGRTAFHDGAGLLVRCSPSTVPPPADHATEYFATEAAAQCQILRGGGKSHTHPLYCSGRCSPPPCHRPSYLEKRSYLRASRRALSICLTVIT